MSELLDLQMSIHFSDPYAWLVGLFGEDRVVRNGACIEIVTRKYNQGYPVVQFNGLTWLLYRVVYLFAYGPIAKGKVVRHACDNKLCGNPNHYVLGSHRDNSEDLLERGPKTKLGRPAGVTKEMTDARNLEVKRLVLEGKKTREIAEIFGVSSVRISQIISAQRKQDVLG